LLVEKKISLVIPCYNEESNVIPLLNALYTNITGYLLEIILVDDASKDDTLNVIKTAALKDPNIFYLSFSKNFGHQYAIKAGLDYATGDCVICMDADLQHPPNKINELLSHWNDGYQIVSTLRKEDESSSLFKKWSSILFYKIINLLTDITIEKGSADFRLIDRKIVDILKNDIKEYHLFYRGLISWIGFRHKQIEYTADKRFSGTTKYSLRKMISFALNGITSFSIKPLRLGILLGFFLSFFSLSYALYAILAYYFNDNYITGWASILVSVLFTGGANMILLGIIGEYIGKLYIQSKGRPLYLINQTNIHE
jgi:glycosyltransferase involved in cell wall biosynthesis